MITVLTLKVLNNLKLSKTVENNNAIVYGKVSILLAWKGREGKGKGREGKGKGKGRERKGNGKGREREMEGKGKGREEKGKGKGREREGKGKGKTFINPFKIFAF